MQEEVEQKTIALSVRAARMTYTGVRAKEIGRKLKLDVIIFNIKFWDTKLNLKSQFMIPNNIR